jgi:predicted ribosome quality control (RQC) complex YloA/Tae2 family protein
MSSSYRELKRLRDNALTRFQVELVRYQQSIDTYRPLVRRYDRAQHEVDKPDDKRMTPKNQATRRETAAVELAAAEKALIAARSNNDAREAEMYERWKQYEQSEQALKEYMAEQLLARLGTSLARARRDDDAYMLLRHATSMLQAMPSAAWPATRARIVASLESAGYATPDAGAMRVLMDIDAHHSPP